MAFTNKLRDAIDRLQKQVLALLLRRRREPCEDPEAYRLRRSRAAAREQQRVGRGSGRVADRILCWWQHVCRQEDKQPHLWTAAVLQWRNAAWLQQRRAACGSRSIWAGRLNSRRAQGYVRERWEERLSSATGTAAQWRQNQEQR